MAGGIDISVGLESLGVADLLSPAIVCAVESSIATSLALIKDRWVSEAQSRLYSTRLDYLVGLDIGSIQQPYDNPLTGAVVLMGKVPNAIEQGYTAFDMKPGFMNSPRAARTKSGGWYLTIPIRHGTPGSTSMGSTMPASVYTQSRQLNPYGSGLGNTSLGNMGAGDTAWNGYVHKSNVNSGMVRIVKSYQRATQSQYLTFRRVSNNSDGSSWWHPGYSGAHIAGSIEGFARDTFTRALEDNLGRIPS